MHSSESTRSGPLTPSTRRAEISSGEIELTLNLRRDLVREIRRFKPDAIMCFDPTRLFSGDRYINHPDHRNAGLVALEAIFPAADNPMFYPDMADEGYLPHKIGHLYVVGHSDITVRVDVTDVIDTKIAAILCHKTQISNPKEARTRQFLADILK